MNVLSLFDGMSCGRIALERAGVPVANYFASEIDKHAIKVAMHNYPDTKQLGDVTKWREWQLPQIDLLIGGSPCQGFSFAGKQLAFDDPRSKLFFEYVDCLKHFKPKYFLLENVKMKKESKEKLDSYLGVEGKYFNSELVSFQKRPRFYWCNWDWNLPEDRDVNFQDYKECGDLSEYKVNRTKSREKMWGNGDGRNTLGTCANITNSKKIYCLTIKQDRSPNSGLIEYEDFCRYLTRGELEQAQTLPIGYTKSVSYNQAQAVLGNGWTVDAIAHIFSFLKN